MQIVWSWLWLKFHIKNRKILAGRSMFNRYSVRLVAVMPALRSLRFAYRLLISKVASTSLNAFYYTLKTDSVDHRMWNDVTTGKTLSVIPEQLDSQPLFLSIDDTLIEKFGKKFEHASNTGNVCLWNPLHWQSQRPETGNSHRRNLRCFLSG